MRPSFIPAAVLAATILIQMSASAAPLALTPNQDPVKTRSVGPMKLLREFGGPDQVSLLNNGDVLWAFNHKGQGGTSLLFVINPTGKIIIHRDMRAWMIRPYQPPSSPRSLPVDKYHPGAKLLPYQPKMEAMAHGQ